MPHLKKLLKVLLIFTLCLIFRWEDVLRVFLLTLRLFQVHAVSLSPRLRPPALSILPADEITPGGRCQSISIQSDLMPYLPQVCPPQWHCTCASVTLQVRKGGLLISAVAYHNMNLGCFQQRVCVTKVFSFDLYHTLRCSSFSLMHWSAVTVMLRLCDCWEYCPSEGQEPITWIQNKQWCIDATPHSFLIWIWAFLYTFSQSNMFTRIELNLTQVPQGVYISTHLYIFIHRHLTSSELG